MFTLFKKLKAGHGAGGPELCNVTYCVYTASGKPRRRQETAASAGRTGGKVQQITEPAPPGARNDSATPAAAEKRHGVAH